MECAFGLKCSISGGDPVKIYCLKIFLLLFSFGRSDLQPIIMDYSNKRSEFHFLQNKTILVSFSLKTVSN